jgi:hypothetical protein
MMSVMGKAAPKRDPARLRKLHRAAGYVYIALLVPLAAFGVGFLIENGDGLSARGTLHFVLAMALLAVLLLKFLTVKTHRQFLKQAPVLGMTLFSLTLVIFLITAGFFFIKVVAGK